MIGGSVGSSARSVKGFLLVDDGVADIARLRRNYLVRLIVCETCQIGLERKLEMTAATTLSQQSIKLFQITTSSTYNCTTADLMTIAVHDSPSILP